MRFKGKVDWWWHACTALMFASTLWFLILLALSIADSSLQETAVLAVSILFFILFDGFFIDSSIRNYVDFHEDSLKVRVSIFTDTIPYSKIISIKETNDPLASLAVSLDRLQIQQGPYDLDCTMVAVQDKDGFLAEIIKRNPQIQIERKNPTNTALTESNDPMLD